MSTAIQYLHLYFMTYRTSACISLIFCMVLYGILLIIKINSYQESISAQKRHNYCVSDEAIIRIIIQDIVNIH